MSEDAPRDSYVLQVLENTQRYAQSLLQHNERLVSLVASLHADRDPPVVEIPRGREAATDIDDLRSRVAAIEVEERRLQGELHSLRQEVRRSIEVKEGLQQELIQLHRENLRFSAEYVDVQQQNSNLANLYVASYRLHSTLNRAEVVATISEILINLIGCEEFVVFEVDAGATTLRPLTSMGIDPDLLPRIPLGTGAIGRTALDGGPRIEPPASLCAPYEADLTACVPLKLDGRVTGVIALFKLLAHKGKLEAIDHELFDLLATHAAPALYCSGMAAQAKGP